jgi:hypothetical protein
MDSTNSDLLSSTVLVRSVTVPSSLSRSLETVLITVPESVPKSAATLFIELVNSDLLDVTVPSSVSRSLETVLSLILRSELIALRSVSLAKSVNASGRPST